MRIQSDCVVHLRYTLKDDQGELLEEVDLAEPFIYLHGYENIIPGLEETLDGLQPGDTFQVTLEPEEAYGPYNLQFQQRVNRAEFPEDMDLHPGMAFELIPDHNDTNDVFGKAGTGLIFYIKEAGGDDVLIDANHPLAGKQLNFIGEILEVRPATTLEKDHGHAHGPHTEH